MDRLTDEQISATLFLMDGDQYYDDPSGYFEIALTELQQARVEIERLRGALQVYADRSS